MTRLRIELNTITENVTSNVIHKLYETAKAIIDAEEANEVQESLVSLKGNLLVSKAYGDEIDWLEAKFPDLHITAGARYIRFADSVVENICVTNWGDGTGCTEDDLYAVNTFSGSVFGGNTSITTFNELLYFKPTAFNQMGLLKGCSSLTEVTLPSGTPYIGQDMFTNCSNLTTIRNTESITEIKGLGNCSKLVSINTPNLISVGNWGCSGCTLLSTIDTSNVTSIGQSSFLNCTSLTSVDLSSCASIGWSAFLGCTSLASIDLSNVTSIGNDAFNGCTGLTTINLSNCTSIGSGAFRSCSSLTSVILGSNITNIPEYAFGQSGLTSVSSNYVTTIGRLAFWGCPNLHSVDFPNVTSINDEWELVDPTYINMPLSNKLPGLSGTGGTLTDVVIPQSVTVLKNNWAWYYNNLQSVKFQTAIPPTLGTNIVRDSVTIYVPSANLSDYLTAYPGYSSLMIGY